MGKYLTGTFSNILWGLVAVVSVSIAGLIIGLGMILVSGIIGAGIDWSRVM